METVTQNNYYAAFFYNYACVCYIQNFDDRRFTHIYYLYFIAVDAKVTKKTLGLENFNLMTNHIAYNSGHTVLDHNTIVTNNG